MPCIGFCVFGRTRASGVRRCATTRARSTVDTGGGPGRASRSAARPRPARSVTFYYLSNHVWRVAGAWLIKDSSLDTSRALDGLSE